jgi:hypothetical protein
MKNFKWIIIASLILSCTNTNLKKKNSVDNPVELDSTYISNNTYYFEIVNSGIEGEGADFLKNAITQSQFFVLGEYHGGRQISFLTNALIRELKTNNYNFAVFEVGKFSAQKLTELSEISNETVSNLFNFNSKYYHALMEDIPIPFFDGKEDAAFLETVSSSGMQIWGIDQEYYQSVLFLTKEMLNSVKEKDNYTEIEEAWKKANFIIYQKFDEDATGDIQVFEEIKKDKDVMSFFELFEENDTIATEIIKHLNISWDIYTNWRRGSHGKRVNYMRKNFLNYYNRVETAWKNPKVFIKIGSMHAAYTPISNGYYDIGALIEEIAILNSTESTNIVCDYRYFEGEDLIGDGNKRFLQFAKKDRWTLIDLKKIRSDFYNGEIHIPEGDDYQDTKRKINGYDILLITPEDKSTSPNYSTEL